MSRDLRRYASQTTYQLVGGAILLLLIVGLGLVWFIYGPAAAVMGLACLFGALVPVGLIAVFIFGIDWIVKRANQE